jgi:hypothetical protein
MKIIKELNGHCQLGTFLENVSNPLSLTKIPPLNLYDEIML